MYWEQDATFILEPRTVIIGWPANHPKISILMIFWGTRHDYQILLSCLGRIIVYKHLWSGTLPPWKSQQWCVCLSKVSLKKHIPWCPNINRETYRLSFSCPSSNTKSRKHANTQVNSRKTIRRGVIFFTALVQWLHAGVLWSRGVSKHRHEFALQAPTAAYPVLFPVHLNGLPTILCHISASIWRSKGLLKYDQIILTNMI